MSECGEIMKLSDDLRQSVLQAAIQGKLTEQHPEDGNAEDLLKQIRAEKKKLITEGKIKKEKPLPPIDDDEKPFDIPDNWAWIRLGEVINLISGTSYEKKDICKKGLRILRGGNLVKEKIEIFDDDVFLPEKYSDNEKKIKNQDIVIIASTGSLKGIGRAAFVNNTFKEAQVGAFLRIIRPLYDNIAEYIKIIFQGQYYREHISNIVNGIGIKNIRESYIMEFLIPLPPLAEQERIVERVEEIMKKIDELDKAETELEALKKKFPGDMRDALLQAAIQGKLTEQCPEDGNAEDLLKEIRAEKKKLIAEGKIKKEKPLPPIDDDEKPFDIPDNWEWVRLGEIFQHNTGKALNSANNIGKPLEYITTSNVYWNRFELTKLKTMLFTENEIKKCTIQKGDLLVLEGGDVGRAAIWNYDFPMRIQNHIHRLRAYKQVNTEFFYYTFLLYKNSSLINGKGIGIQGLSSNVLNSLIIPLPPLTEQERIVERLNKLLPLCEAMKGE